MLGFDLDLADLSDGGRTMIADGLRRAGLPAASVRNIGSALRHYGDMTWLPIGASAGAATPGCLPVAAATPVALVCPDPAVVRANVPDLMRLYGDILAELQARGVLRTANGPVGDYAEHLFARAFGWTLAGNGEGGFDATDAAGLRYQIKGRRLATVKTARQLSAIRRLPERGFERLAVVLFDAQLAVHRAALLPYPLVVERELHCSHQ